ncbi:MAG: hypothetical protein IJ374_00600 [Lachnospiraceae bacterium]|nr:hypothetical protein [Lachnospiraceae bacterium]
MNNKKKTMRRLAGGIAAVILLIGCLCITTYALFYVTVRVEDNYFQTGEIKINLNDEKPVITADEYIFEPGMTVIKDFFIENESTWEVYYRIYFENVDGDLADVLEIAVKDGDKILWEGTASELTRENVEATDDTLAIDERRELELWFHYPEESGNETQDESLTFNLSAEAVQTKNNPDKLFE